MKRSRRHPPKATTVVIRTELVSEKTGSAFHPGGVLCTVIYGRAEWGNVRYATAGRLRAPIRASGFLLACGAGAFRETGGEKRSGEPGEQLAEQGRAG